jgi:hypothetical protein
MRCQVEGCLNLVSQAGHDFCKDHWKAERNGRVTRCQKCERWHDTGKPLCRACYNSATSDPKAPGTPDETESAGFLSSTRLGNHFGLSNIKINLILAELGWIEKYVKGWIPTDRGNALGANVKEMRNGTPYTVWPESILKNPVLCDSIS